MDTDTLLIGGAIVAVLIVAILAIAYLVRKRAECPLPPAAIGFWTTPDRSKVATVVACPAGSTIAVQNADYGAPWSRCAWVDVTAAAQNIMNGKNSYQVPAGASVKAMLGVTTSCPKDDAATFAGSYTCAVTAPAS